jgi:hypothetical protein
MLTICLTDILRRCPLTGYPLMALCSQKICKTILIFSLFISSGARWYLLRCVSLLLAQTRSAGMSAIPPLLWDKRTSRGRPFGSE